MKPRLYLPPCSPCGFEPPRDSATRAAHPGNGGPRLPARSPHFYPNRSIDKANALVDAAVALFPNLLPEETP